MQNENTVRWAGLRDRGIWARFERTRWHGESLGCVGMEWGRAEGRGSKWGASELWEFGSMGLAWSGLAQAGVIVGESHSDSHRQQEPVGTCAIDLPCSIDLGPTQHED